MKVLTIAELRTVDGGASKYVYCPICNYKYKCGLIERLLWNNARVEGSLMQDHYSYRYGYTSSSRVH